MADDARTNPGGMGVTAAKLKRLALLHTGNARPPPVADSRKRKRFGNESDGKSQKVKRNQPASGSKKATSTSTSLPRGIAEESGSQQAGVADLCYATLPAGSLDLPAARCKIKNLKSVSASAILASFVDATAVGSNGIAEVALKLQDKSLLLDNPVTKPANQRMPSHLHNARAPKPMSRTKLKALGLDSNLPKVVRYEELQPLRELWNKHVQEQLRLHGTPSDWLSELSMLGCEMRVLRCPNPKFAGCQGTVIQDGRETVRLVLPDNLLRTVPKPQSVFEVVVGNHSVQIFGQKSSAGRRR